MTLAKASGRARKKPIEIDYFHWTGQPPNHWPDWMRHNMAIRYEVSNLQIDVDTGGAARCNKGDVVIKGVNGEIYPCSLNVFEKTYDTID